MWSEWNGESFFFQDVFLFRQKLCVYFFELICKQEKEKMGMFHFNKQATVKFITYSFIFFFLSIDNKKKYVGNW